MEDNKNINIVSVGRSGGKMLMITQRMLRRIKALGYTYVIMRESKDEYGEVLEEMEQVVIVDGLFHLTKGFIKQSSSDGGTVRAKGMPMLMIPYEQSQKIQNGDIVSISDKKYKITDKNNIEELNVVVDLSLELILDGNI